MEGIKIEVSKCTGCGQCVLACSFIKTGTFDLKKSCIRIIQWEDYCLSVPLLCQQCDDARCIWVCPTDALERHPDTGVIMVDPDACINCELCMKECTYQVIYMNDAAVPVICDLCGGSPVCVSSCFPGALTLAEIPEGEEQPFRPIHEVLNARRRGENIEPPEFLIDHEELGK